MQTVRTVAPRYESRLALSINTGGKLRYFVPTERAVLRTENLTKQFSGLTAVDSVSWTLGDGEVKGVLGPNGAGKSTFFNLIAGVISPTAGRIYFGGEDITGEPADKIARRGIGLTFQTSNLFDDRTVLENVRFAAQAGKRTYDIFTKAENLKDVNRRADDVIEQVGLKGFEDAVIDELSHGDQRRVEIAIVLATDPEVILFDEPAAGVAARELDELKEILAQLVERDGQTMVIIEHNVGFLLDLVDTVTVLHEGQILAQATPEQITENEEVQRVYLE